MIDEPHMTGGSPVTSAASAIITPVSARIAGSGTPSTNSATTRPVGMVMFSLRTVRLSSATTRPPRCSGARREDQLRAFGTGVTRDADFVLVSPVDPRRIGMSLARTSVRRKGGARAGSGADGATGAITQVLDVFAGCIRGLGGVGDHPYVASGGQPTLEGL